MLNDWLVSADGASLNPTIYLTISLYANPTTCLTKLANGSSNQRLTESNHFFYIPLLFYLLDNSIIR